MAFMMQGVTPVAGGGGVGDPDPALGRGSLAFQKVEGFRRVKAPGPGHWGVSQTPRHMLVLLAFWNCLAFLMGRNSYFWWL